MANVRNLHDFRSTRLVIFDWDGTLFDSTEVIARSLCRAADDVGLGQVDIAQARQVIGLGFGEALDALLGELTTTQAAALMQQYHRYYFVEEQKVRLFDGVLPLLQQLSMQQRYLAVATGKSRAGLNHIWDSRPDLKSLFASTRTADETASKPHPQMLHEILNELGCRADEAVMVGDTVFDLDMARAAGVPSIAVAYGAHPSAQLAAAQPSALVHSVAALSVLLSGEE